MTNQHRPDLFSCRFSPFETVAIDQFQFMAQEVELPRDFLKIVRIPGAGTLIFGTRMLYFACTTLVAAARVK